MFPLVDRLNVAKGGVIVYGGWKTALENNNFSFVIEGCVVVQTPVIDNRGDHFDFILEFGYVFPIVF